MKTKPLRAINLFVIILIFCACAPQTKSQDGHADPTFPQLFLLSKGLTTDTLKLAFLHTLSMEPSTYSVAVVVNASTTEEKKQKKANKIRSQFSAMGFDSLKIEQFDVMERDPIELSDFGIIYILGGNPFLLLEEVRKSGADKVLTEIATQDRILMGYSAGSLLFGPSLALMDYADDLLGFNELDLKELESLGLYSFHIFPHYGDFTKQVPELAGLIDQFENESDLPVYRLNDNQGIIYRGGIIELVGK